MHFAKSVPAAPGRGDGSSAPRERSATPRAAPPPAPVPPVSCRGPGHLGQLRLVPSRRGAPALERKVNVCSLRDARAVRGPAAAGSLDSPAARSPLRETVW